MAEIFEVSQINEYLRQRFEADEFLGSLLIRGELSNYKIYPSGHHYFTLKDSQSAIRCVMFKGSAMRLRFRPETGMKVIAGGRIAVFPRDGAYQLYCTSLTPEGVGDLHVAFEQLKLKLQAEGLFARERKQALPRFPHRIAIITSSAGAALHDMLRILRKRYPLTEVKLLGVRVQGPRCALYNASHHANEWITTPVLLLFLEQYAYAVATEGRILGMDAQQLWRRTTLWLVPMVNPDGVDLVTGAIRPGSPQYQAAQRIAAGFPEIPFPGGWKANLTGTDLNLNYPAGWEQARTNKFALGFTGPAPRDYVGASPLDQPETAAMAALTQAIRPDVTLSYHTQGEEIYWRFQDYAPPGAQELGERLARVSGYRLEDTPFASGFAGYKDWFLQDFRRPGYTIEAGLGTNPLPLSQFDEIYRRNIGILVHALP